MKVIVVLDTGPLGMVTHPKADPERPIEQWLVDLLRADISVCIPEIADYELRREFLLNNNLKSIRRLEELEAELEFAPISTSVMRLASEYWAQARKMGKPTANDKALDGDMILVAHANLLTAPTTKVVVATGNVAHLATFVDARHWSAVTPASVIS